MRLEQAHQQRVVAGQPLAALARLLEPEPPVLGAVGVRGAMKHAFAGRKVLEPVGRLAVDVAAAAVVAVAAAWCFAASNALRRRRRWLVARSA